MNLPKTGLLVRGLLIILPLVLVLTLVSLFLPVQQVSIEGIGTLSLETKVTLSVGSEVAYASPAVPVVETWTDNGSSTASATLTLSKPSGVAVGDLLVLIPMNEDASAGAEFTDNLSGWNYIGTSGDSNCDCDIGAFWRIADGTEGSTIDVTATSSDQWMGFYVRISGAHGTTPINASAFSQSATSATSHNVGGVTTDVDDCLVLYALAFDGSISDGQPFSVSGTGWAEISEYSSGGFSSCDGCFGSRDLVSQGASGTATVGCNSSDGAAWFQIAIAPSAAAPTYQSFTEAKSGPDIGSPNNVTSITVNKPAGTASGDLLIGVVVTDDEAGTFTPPAGWTLIDSGTNGTVVTLGTWYKIAGASEPASYTWSWTNPQTVYAFIVRITGHDSSNPIDVSGFATGNSLTPTCPDVTTTVNDTLVLRIFGANWAEVTVDGGYPSGHTGITVDVSGDPTQIGQCSGGAAYKTQAAIGATGTAAFTMTGAHEWRALTVAIAPAAALPDISNTPTSKNFGLVAESSSYWSKDGSPTFPLDDGECYFTVTNNSSGAVNISIKATNFGGGVGWTLAGTPGVDTVTLKAGKSGDVLETNMVTLTTSDQSFISNLGASSSQMWEIKLETGTFTDGAPKSSTITLTATF